MAKPLDLSAYPMEYFQAIENAARAGSAEYTGSMAEISALRFELYAFRKALLRAQHQLAIMARPLKFLIRENLDGSAQLTILRSDNSRSAQLIRAQLSKAEPVWPIQPNPMLPTLPEPSLERLLSVKPPEDPVESALKKLGYFTKAEKDKASE